MASAIATPTSSFYFSSLLPSSTTTRKQSEWNISNSAISLAQVSNFEFSKLVPQMGLCQFSQWNGLKNLGISTPQLIVKMERKGKNKGKGVYASLFGVGAPEALVIGVVALLVFGPKGLAEVARNLGKTLREFQPTIRELQDVSREFKSTLEREIGLDDDNKDSNQYTNSSSTSRTSSSPPPNSSSESSQKEFDPNGSPSPNKSYSTEDYLKITEEQLKAASTAQQQKGNTSPDESQSEFQKKSQDAPEQAASAMPSPGKTENDD